VPELWNRFSYWLEFWLSNHNGIPVGYATTLVLMERSEVCYQSVDVQTKWEERTSAESPEWGIAKSQGNKQNCLEFTPNPRMYLRLIALIAAALCATLVDAETIQPVEGGLQPAYERIASIEAEIQNLGKSREESGALKKDRLIVEEKIKSLLSEKRRLEAEILRARDISHSPLVTFMTPSNEGAS